MVVIASSLSARASAQPVRAWELAGGYQTLDNNQDKVTLRGWTADAAVRIIPWLAAVAETGGVRETIFEVELRQFALLGGVRAAAGIGPLVEFVQLVAGLSRSTGIVVGESQTEDAFALQPGGGVELPFGGRFAARVQIDRRSILGGPFISDQRHEIRLAASLVVHPRR